MHIADGVLSLPVLGAGAALSLCGIAWGLSKLRFEDLPKAACVSAGFFVASLIHVPIGPSSAHLLLGGLAGILLGPAVFPAIFIALLLQLLLYQFGGFASLGVNVFIMAFPAMLCGLLFQRRMASAKRQWTVFTWGFLAGFLGMGLAALFAAIALLLSGRDFLLAAKLIFVAHLPLMLVEGLATGFAASALKRMRPEAFEGASFDLKLSPAPDSLSR